MWEQGPISESEDKAKGLFFQKISLTPQLNSTKGPKQTTAAHGGNIWLHNKDGNIIQSGDLFVLNTDNPITKPLPSFELLELQLFLQRVLGMVGTAEIDWIKYWMKNWDLDDSDYSVEAPSLTSNDDVENLSLLSEEFQTPQSKLTIPPHPKPGAIELGGEGDGEGILLSV
jgi:hypothetical protein